MKIVFKTPLVKAVVFFALLFFVSPSHAQLVHPGGWHTQADLTIIRSKVQAGEEPWVTGWNAIKDSRPRKNYESNVSGVVTDEFALSKQGHVAYQLAMKWVATGDQEYADAAIGLIDQWVENVDGFNVEGPTLTLSTAAGHMAQAAEILAHGFDGAAGWSPAKVEAAQAWFKSKVYDKWTNTGGMRSSNWGTSCVGGNMSMAVFCDSQEMFKDQVNAYKFGYRDTNDGCAGVAQYIFSPTGQAFESGRDQAHVQGGIGHLVEAALTAWNQEIDLVSYEDYRLVAGVEYHAKYNVGHDDVPWTPNIANPCNNRILGDTKKISSEERGFVSPIYFMCNKLFTQAGQDHPYTYEVITHADYLPEFSNTSHPGMGQLAFVYPPVFIPDPNKKYYIHSPSHKLRVAATGEADAPFTAPMSTTGEQVEWAFVADGKGYWHIQLAAEGKLSRLRARSRSNGQSNMRAAVGRSSLSYFEFTPGALPHTSFMTLPKTTKKYSRLQVDDNGGIKFVPKTQSEEWESFQFTEVFDEPKIDEE